MSAAQPLPRPHRRRAPAPASAPRPKLSLVPPPARTGGKAFFLIACMLVLVAGLIGSLVLNTLMAHGSYEQSTLQRQLAEQAQTQDTLQTQLDSLTAPLHVAQAAKKLGMVQQQAPLMIRISDGSIVGLDG